MTEQSETSSNCQNKNYGFKDENLYGLTCRLLNQNMLLCYEFPVYIDHRQKMLEGLTS